MKSFAMKAVTLSLRSRSSASDLERGAAQILIEQQILAAADFKLARFWSCAQGYERLFHRLAS